MKLANWFKPFEKINPQQRMIIGVSWIALIIIYWFTQFIGNQASLPHTRTGMGWLQITVQRRIDRACRQLPVALFAGNRFFSDRIAGAGISFAAAGVASLAVTMSRLRYLPLTGITFYLAILVSNARTMQVGVLFIFMSLYFITSLLAVLKDIPAEEIDHARSLKCSRWEVLLEVVIKGRFDYVIDVLRQNLAITWMMLVTVESILVAAGGLGVLIKNSDKFMNHGRIVALQLVILLVGLLLDWLLRALRKAAFKYSTF